jgi:hypothetical protein
MAKRKVAGFGKSKGMNTDVPLYPEGKYVFQIEQHSEKESRNGTSTIHTYRLRCVDALGDLEEQQLMVDKVYFHRMIEMHDDHPSYEEWGHIFVDELKSLFDAAGVTDQVKADNVDFELPVGQTVIATIRQKDGQDEQGNPRPENEIRKWEQDEQA